MKALEIIEPGRFKVREVPIPKPGPRGVLVKVLAVTTCPHWDLHIFGGQPMFPGAPLQYPYTVGQPGHEACGEAVAVGGEVREVSVGQRVGLWRDPGHHVPGCYAEFVARPVEDVIPVPSELPPEACAPLELAMCVSAHVLFAEKLDAISDKRVGVFGLGPAGLVFVQLLWAAGAAEVIGFDPLPTRRELAQRLGADAALDPTEDLLDRFPKRGQADCLHCVFDCVGSPDVVHQAMKMTSHLVVLFAVQREPYVFAPRSWGGLTLAGTQPHTREAAEYAVARLVDGRLDLGALVTDVMRLEEYARAVDLLRHRKAVKVAFLPQES
jgi:threonine dehydrogenase-like Zn-dependent dehydrogenase